jgi:hypothetical protein
MGTEERGWLPKFDYYLDESDPDVVVLRRQDGTLVAAFSAQGATKEGILEAAREDYRRLVSHLRALQQRASFPDELPEEAAVVEGSGTIVAVNTAWRRFAEDNGADPGEVWRGRTTWAFARRPGASSRVRPLLRRGAPFRPEGRGRALRPGIPLPLARREALVRGERRALGRRRCTLGSRRPRERDRPQGSALESSKAARTSENSPSRHFGE